ncbi:RluA family pseudouridine synthase [Marinagarivorans algicola]|uniref:RluA family pseudouridine synthase n=1 Tax=Marinagarivorans algicola TaxID=1513270 RepID=UPI0006B4764F|nr:RluA family pseudouridine synthase [Marinagarivorans algicola]
MRIFTYSPPSGIPPVIYEDADYLAINKPSGLLSNPGIAECTHDCALTRLQQAYGEVFLVHRLDCDTSGVMFFAKHKKAEGALKKRLQHREVHKTYMALTWGIPELSHGIIDQPLAANPADRPLQQVSATGKEAITAYTVLDSNPDKHCALLKLEPTTGRTHQLRVHLHYLGHPILGDTFYGHEQCQAAKPRLCLHAEKVEFVQPLSQQAVEVLIPADFT